jgi:hypothetical protein
MSNIANEIVALERTVKEDYPTAKYWRQFIPQTPAPQQFSINFQRNTNETETAAHYRTDREYQLVYFAKDNLDLLSVIDELTEKFGNAIKVKVDETRWLTIESFSVSQPFKTENDIHTFIAILEVSTRFARPQEQSPAVGGLSVRTEGGN